jgi:hypothetical protein
MMNQKTLTQAVTSIVQELEHFSSDDRHRIVSASMTLLGEGSTRLNPKAEHADPPQEQSGELSAKARSWMKQHGLSLEQINEVFHLGEEGSEIIASIPGASKREQVRNAYVLCGIGRLLAVGESRFDDKAARRICESGGFFDSTNHMKYMKGSEFTGTREKGWVLTTPGLNLGASLIAQLSTD